MAYINEKYVPKKEESELTRRQNAWTTALLGLKKAPIDTSPYRRRYSNITQGGLEATNYETKKRNEREANYLEALRNKINQANARTINVNTGPSNYNPGGGQFSGNIPNIKGGGSFENFVNAITGQESGGNYGARNSSSGAMGRYQIMPGNISGSHKGWDYEALGYDISASQFMHNPKLQDAIARYKLQQYYKKFGPRGAAIAWYAGPGAVNRVNLNKSQGAYPTINQYANAILKRMGLL
jgi:hypothetical protein